MGDLKFKVGDIVTVVSPHKSSELYYEKEKLMGDELEIVDVNMIRNFPYIVRNKSRQRIENVLFMDSEIEFYNNNLDLAEEDEVESFLS